MKKHQANKFRTALLHIMKRHKIETLRVFGNRLYGYYKNDMEMWARRAFSFSRLENTKYPKHNLLNSDWNIEHHNDKN